VWRRTPLFYVTIWQLCALKGLYAYSSLGRQARRAIMVIRLRDGAMYPADGIWTRAHRAATQRMRQTDRRTEGSYLDVDGGRHDEYSDHDVS